MVRVITARTVEKILLIDADERFLLVSQSLNAAASEDEKASIGRSPKCWMTYPMLRFADKKNYLERSVPFNLQYFSKASDSLVAHDVNVSIGFSVISNFAAGTSIWEIRICNQKSLS